MPNIFAQFMLAIWPVVTIVLFVYLPRDRALIWSVLAGYLILPPSPAAFDFPLLPPLNKVSIPHLSILMVALFLKDAPKLALSRIPQKRQRAIIAMLNPLRLLNLRAVGRDALRLPDSLIGKVLVVVFVLSPILTVMTNPEPLVFQRTIIRGLHAVDAIALPISQVLILIGFLLARKLLISEAAMRDLLLALVIGGLAYALPILIEVRLSPQINVWVYGYFQHVFHQMVRATGFRPIVFLGHGIWVAFFVMSALVAAVTLWRNEPGNSRLRYFLGAGVLGTLLVLCKTLGAVLYAMAMVPLLFLLRPRNQIRVAVLLAALSLAYPLAKGFDLVPVNWMLQQAEKVNEERAGSLKFRFENEDTLFDRVDLKPLFGWGSWGRNHEHDPGSGIITTVSDGRWIIVFGVFGWVGFLAEFGLLALPLFMLWQVTRLRPDRPVSPYVGALALLLAINMVDLLPNATLTPITWLMAGALLGHAEYLRRTTRVRAGQSDTEAEVKTNKRRTIL